MDPVEMAWYKYMFMAALAAMGGAVSYLYRVGKHDIRFSIIQFIGEVCASGFTGVVMFLLCQHWEVEVHLAAAIVGISGHMGSRTLTFIERRVYNWLKEHRLDR